MASKRPLSFPKSRRSLRPTEFARVKREGCTQRGRLILITVLKLEKSGPFRAGFVVSRRVGGAIIRNRVRRRLREVVRRHQEGVAENLWIVIVARAAASAACYEALQDEWLRLAKRASILTPS